MNEERAKQLIELGWAEREVRRIKKYFHPKRSGKYKMDIYDIDDLSYEPEEGVFVETVFFDNAIDLSIIHYFFEGLAYVMSETGSDEEIGRGIIDFAPFDEMSDWEGKDWGFLGYEGTRRITKDATGLMFENNKGGDVIEISVRDCFSGTVKILEQDEDKCLVAVQNVSMLSQYHQPMKKGDRIWVHKKDLVSPVS